MRNLIVDSLTYWANTMHVDGFRFDLAYELGREGSDGRDFNNNATTLVAIAQAASNNGFKVVAEPWDTSGFGVGQFPAGWSEWNGNYRDNLRQFEKGDNSQVGNLGASITATWSGFATPAGERQLRHRPRRLHPQRPRLLQHQAERHRPLQPHRRGRRQRQRHQRQLGQRRRRGAAPPADPQLRRPDASSTRASPMLLAGDEFRRTQSGNNNGYMADNACGWIDWSLKTTNQKTYDFFRKLIAFRKAHPGLRRSVDSAAPTTTPTATRTSPGTAPRRTPRTGAPPRTRWPG